MTRGRITLMTTFVTLTWTTILTGGIGARAEASETTDLSGTWLFRLDPNAVGIREKWFNETLPDQVRLPGSVEENRRGTQTTQPAVGRLTRVYEYVGAAWFQRELTIPESWQGKRITLFLERCHWETHVWVDGKDLGTQNSLCVPHVYDLTDALPPGRHRLTLLVDNSIKLNIGPWGHSLTDETQTNWNGIVGRIELNAHAPVWIDAVQVYSQVSDHHVKAHLTLANRTNAAAQVSIEAVVTPCGQDRPIHRSVTEVHAGAGRRQFEMNLALPPDAPLWDEFAPVRCDLRLSTSAISPAGRFAHTRTVNFGLREFGTRGSQFVLNSRPVFLRGTLECAIFPLTGYPSMDMDAWRRIFTVARSYGLNHMRFHSWCPPEAAFAAADEAGVLLQVEAPFWTGDVGRDAKRDDFIHAELDRILDTYGNHPSFCMMTMGNELEGEYSFLRSLVRYAHQKDPRHLFSTATCFRGPHSENDDFYVLHMTPKGWLRYEGRFANEVPTTDPDYRASIAGYAKPHVSHEMGQWAMYPNFQEAAKYTGTLRALNFEAYRESLTRNGMIDQAEAFRRASGTFMLLLYKEEIEATLRTPNYGGFQLLDVRDFPGQGTALVGMLDPFWDSKGLIAPETFRRYCNSTVPLLRLPKRVWTTNQTLAAKIEVAHHGANPLNQVTPSWTLKDTQGRTVAGGKLPPTTVQPGTLSPLGQLSVALGEIHAPSKYTVTVTLEGTAFANDWDLWVYPASPPPSPTGEAQVYEAWNDAAKKALNEGRKVVLIPPASTPTSRSLPGTFPSVFWCFRLFSGQVGTMGILCDPAHPALANFPTDSHSNWQWWELMSRSRSLILNQTPAAFRPIVQVIDNFDRNHKLGAVLEAKVGNGKLLVCTIDLKSDLDSRPVARQLRHSLLSYANSNRFQPSQELSLSLLDALLATPSIARYRREPKATDKAALDIKAAAHVPPNRSQNWQPSHDRVNRLKTGFGYQVSGGTWLDETGSAWHNATLNLTVTCPKGFSGTLYAHFHDWNRLGRAADITLNDRHLGRLEDHTGPGVWLALPVKAAETANGSIRLSARANSGPNVMITRIILVPAD